MIRLKPVLLYICVSTILIAPYLYNGGPFIYYDSYDYLDLLATLKNPTPSHSLFMLFINYIFSIGFNFSSLIIFIQYLLVIIILFLLIYNRKFTQSLPLYLYSLLFIPALLILSFQASTIMPDIYLFYMVMSFYFLQNKKIYTKSFGVLLVLSLICHKAHILVFIIALVIEKFILRKEISKTIIYSSLISLLLVFSEAIYKKNAGNYQFSQTSIYFASTLAEEDIFLKATTNLCKTKNLKVCAFKHKIRNKPDDFLWNKDNLISQTFPSKSVYVSFRLAQEEINEVTVFALKNYTLEILYKLIKRATFDNLIKTYQSENLIINCNLKKAFPELKETIIKMGLDKTKQMQGQLDFSYYQVYIVSAYLFMLIGIITYFKSPLRNKHIFFLIFILSFTIAPVASTHIQRYLIKSVFCLIPIVIYFIYHKLLSEKS